MLIRSGLLVASLTMLSRIFGMLRELFIATTFGTSYIADSVNIAFKLPNLFRRILGEGALSSVFVPIFTEKLAISKEIANSFASKVLFWLMVIILIITGFIEYFMPELMMLLAPGFASNPEKFSLTITLSRITIFYMLLISLTAIIGSMLNSIGRFAPFAATSIIMNIGIVLGTIGLTHFMENYYAIALAVIPSGVIQLAFIVFSAYRAGLRINLPKISYKDKDIAKLLRLMGPATVTAGVVQINLFISQSISSFIPGAVSILSYADRLYQLPMSIIGVTFGTILLPTLSRLYKTDEIEKAKKTQDNAIKIGLFLSLPCSVVLIVLACPIISLIYHYGAFTLEDVVATAETIAVFAIGLPAFVLSKIFMPIFYAHQDTTTPMKITIYTIAANVILNLILMQPLDYVGIALGSSLASWYGVYLSVKHTKKYGYFSLTNDLVIFIAKLILSCIVSGGAMYASYAGISDIFLNDGVLDRIIKVFFALIIGGAFYLIVALLLKVISKEMITKIYRK